MLAGELAHQAGMKNPRIREADWDYRVSNPTEVRRAKRGKTAPLTTIKKIRDEVAGLVT
jgi:hypothetical protein